MHLKSTIILIAFSFLFQMSVVTKVAAQKKNKNLVIVKSDPPGAMVYFEGENNFIGITPFKLYHNFRGLYKIITIKKGYEKGKKEYFFNGNEKGIMRLKLSPKTRLKAGVRSFVFPGWGQLYSERKTSGILMNLIQVGAVIGTLISEKDYNEAVDDYEKTLKLYEENKKQYLRHTYWDMVVKKHKKADDFYERRQIWIGITGGIWIYNILDSIFFFPSFNKEIFNRSSPTISPNIQNGITKITLSMSF